MIASSNNSSLKETLSIAQACVITLQGNASNNMQQDAFFFLDNWYQEDLGGNGSDTSCITILLSSF